MNQAWTRRCALLLTAATGFAGLVYEVAWEQLLATLLGSDSAATAAVLGLFLGGLAAGYALFGRLSLRLLAGPARGRPRRLLLAYGAVEAAVGLHALAFVPLLDAVRSLSLALPGVSGPLAFARDVGLAAVVILPGAVCMGATVPLLTQALARDLGHATRIHAQVYALNTLGAFAGALAAGFWLIPALGLQGVLWAMAGLDLTAGLAFGWLGSRGSSLAWTPSPPAVHEVPAEPARLRAFAGIALLIGFALMSLQTVLIRLGALSLGASQYTFSLVVAAFVACIAGGSFGVAALRRISPAILVWNLWALVSLLAILYAPLQNATWAAHLLRSNFGRSPGEMVGYLLAVLAVLLVVMGPALLLAGATLPLVFHHLRRAQGDLGARAGALYAWNTAGSLAGALLGGYLLLYWLDLHQVYRLALAALAVAAGLATRQVLGVRRWQVAAATLASIALIAALPAWSPDRLAAGLFRDREALPGAFEGPAALFAANPRGEILFYTDGPTASISVKQGAGRDGQLDRAIVTDGKSDGFARSERTTTGLLALVPALLARRVERAFVIGYGTGVTAASLADLDETREVEVAEISRGVMAAASFFDPYNGGASRNPEIEIIERDAYRALLRSREGFDVIVSEPSNPWVAGVEMLYSREFLEAARDRLREGGVHAQWFHLYDVDAETLGLVLRTYAAVFEHVSVWYTLDADLLLIGLRDVDAALDVDRIAARAALPDFARGLRRAGIGGLPQLFAHELLPVGVLEELDLRGPLHTLLHPRLGHAAARAFFAGGAARLPWSSRADAARVGARHSLVRRLARLEGGALSERDEAPLVAETCAYQPRRCAALLAEWRSRRPHSAAREALWDAGAVPATIAGVDAHRVVRGLLPLYDEDVVPAGDDALAAAMAATERFARFYHHAAPFDRGALAEQWRRCEHSSALASRCRAKRARAEEVLGAFGADPTNHARVALPVGLGAPSGSPGAG